MQRKTREDAGARVAQAFLPVRHWWGEGRADQQKPR